VSLSEIGTLHELHPYVSSGAILRYLAAKYKVPDHWYPSKLEDHARVEECLDWNDANMKEGASGYFVCVRLYHEHVRCMAIKCFANTLPAPYQPTQ